MSHHWQFVDEPDISAILVWRSNILFGFSFFFCWIFALNLARRQNRWKMCEKIVCFCCSIRVAKSFPQRYVLAMLSFASSVCMYMIRVCLAISMTQMVKPITSNASTLRLADDAACPMRYTDTAHAIIKNVTVNCWHFAIDSTLDTMNLIIKLYYNICSCMQPVTIPRCTHSTGHKNNKVSFCRLSTLVSHCSNLWHRIWRLDFLLW